MVKMGIKHVSLRYLELNNISFTNNQYFIILFKFGHRYFKMCSELEIALYRFIGDNITGTI